MPKTVIALFDNIGQAEDAVNALRASGFADESIQVQTGDEFLERSQLPPPAHERDRVWPSIKTFFEEIGLGMPAPPQREGKYYPIERDDAVILLEVSDDRADTAADVLDGQGAVNIDERRRQAGTSLHRASGLESETSGRTPPHLAEVEPHGDIDERALATGKPGEGRKHHARIYEQRSRPQREKPHNTPTKH